MTDKTQLLPKQVPDDLNYLIGDRIKSCRLNKKMSLKELGDQINASKNQINNWEMGIRAVSVEYLLQLAIFFDVSLDWLAHNSTLSDASQGGVHVINNDLMAPYLLRGDTLEINTNTTDFDEDGIYALSVKGNITVRWIRKELIGDGYIITEGDSDNIERPGTTKIKDAAALKELNIIGKIHSLKRKI